MNVTELRQLAIDSQLLPADQADERARQWTARGGTTANGEGFLDWLVADRVLTGFQAAALRADVAGPHRLGPYRVFERLTAGRLGDAYRGIHEEFQQAVSLKVFPAALNQNPEHVARLGREARVSMDVDHLHVVRTYHVGRAGEITFIAFEELQGETLADRLGRVGRLPYFEACQLLHQVAEGLAYLHSKEIIYRDICPMNLWVTAHGFVKIMEFGAARDALSFLDLQGADGEAGGLTLNQAGGMVLGHYDYMAPEQAQDPHAANALCDLYGLGCTLYHCLTGRVPFPDRNPVRQMLRHANEAVVPPSRSVPEIPKVVDDIVLKLLAKKPQDRFSSADDVAAALGQIAPLPPGATPDNIHQGFLDWLRTAAGETPDGVMAVAVNPEFQEFADWLSEGARV
jgi:serine/threonine-protein kinase